MEKEELLKLIEQLPDGAIIALNELSYDGTPNSKPIVKIEYEEYINTWIIK